MKIAKYSIYVIAVIIIKLSAESGNPLGFVFSFALFLLAGKISKKLFGKDPMGE